MSYKNVSNQTVKFLTELENNPFGTIISKLKDKFLDISTQHLFTLARNCYINGYVTREKRGRFYSYKLTALGHSIAHSKKIPETHLNTFAIIFKKSIAIPLYLLFCFIVIGI